MNRNDVATLHRALGRYKKLSMRARSEVAELQLRHGWRAAALHAARKCQAITLGLSGGELSPCEIFEEEVGGIRQIWLADPAGVDQQRPMTASILKRLLQLGLSRYEPDPVAAVRIAEERRRTTPPSGDAA